MCKGDNINTTRVFDAYHMRGTMLQALNAETQAYEVDAIIQSISQMRKLRPKEDK